jgi:DNA polymerase III psi subunit
MFGYLLNVDSWAYWQDSSIPEEQDKAQADPHQFEMVECYSTDGNIGANGHAGTDIKAPADTPVYAAADGGVMEWRSPGLNSMIVLKHCLGGTWDETNQCAGGKQWYTTYMHIVTNEDLLTENFAVTQGTQLGTIYDQSINSHLHFEVGLDKRGYTTFENPWGRDESPWLGCMWLDQSICPNPNPDFNRMTFYTNTGGLSIRQGETNIEISGAQGVKQIRLWGNRIALLDSQNNLRVREGEFSTSEDSISNWAMLAENVLDFQLTDQRIAILDAKRNLFVSENGGEWVLQAKNIRAFSISDHRVGYLTDSGELYVKEGDLNNEWVALANNVSAFQLNDNRIAIADSQGNLAVNEGEVNAEWQQMTEAQRVRAFQLTNLRVGIIDAENNLLVKDGNLRAEWVQIAKNADAFQLSNYRMLFRSADGTFKYQEGNVYQPWSDLPSDLQDVFLNDDLPVFIQ